MMMMKKEEQLQQSHFLVVPVAERLAAQCVYLKTTPKLYQLPSFIRGEQGEGPHDMTPYDILQPEGWSFSQKRTPRGRQSLRRYPTPQPTRFPPAGCAPAGATLTAAYCDPQLAFSAFINASAHTRAPCPSGQCTPVCGCDRRAEHGSLTCPACAQQPWRVQRSARPTPVGAGLLRGSRSD